MNKIFQSTVIGIALALAAAGALAEGIGKVKVLSGEVTIEREGKRIPATLGAAVLQSDRIHTGKDGSVGLLLDDDSRLSLGPNSTIAMDKFDYDIATNDGAADVSMKKGTLSVISGKLTRKTPCALKVRTPAAVLAVRGTEFSVMVEDPEQPQAR